MSLVVEWRHFSSGTVYDITDRINLTDGAFSVTENAEELTVGASTLVIDDPDGDFDIPGHSYIRVTETECPDEKVIWAGFVTIRHVKRATGFLTGAQRTWTGNLDDVNTVIARRILSEANDADRPAETDVERIQWLFDEGFLGVLDTYFSTANPVAMDAANLVGMGVYDAVNDCMLQSGKNSFQQDISDGIGGYIGFTYYDFASSEALSSDLQISNYISDITAEVGRPSPSGPAQTWYASLDTDMERDPTRIYWKVRGQYDGGTVTRTRSATAIEFAARETTASWPLVKTAAIANARADRYLLDISTEEDVITTTIWVHPDHVNDARAGRRIQARFSHLPGYEDWTWMRILNRTVTFETPEVYRIQYTLSPGSPSNPAGSCTSIIAAMQTYDTGAQYDLSSFFSPLTISPDDPVEFPSVCIGFIGMANQASAFGQTPTGMTGFTIIDDSRTGCGTSGGFATLTSAGYKVVTSGSPGAMSVNWTSAGGGNAIGYRGLAIYLPTSATSPVQEAAQCDSGDTTTLGAPPTVGNILILCRFFEVSGAGPPDPPTGYNKIVNQVGFRGGLGPSDTMFMDICARCVQEGDTAAQFTGDSSFSHWSFLSEWALT